MNGASGTSDIEGKAATGSGERGGSRTSFKTKDSSTDSLGPDYTDLGKPNLRKSAEEKSRQDLQD
jgi:hypothetical protein